MLKNHKKGLALSIAIGTIVAASAIGTVPAFAQEDVVEEIVITGSRIRSSVSDAPRPVTTLPIEEMRLSGVDSIADTLRDTSYNALGSYVQQSGSSFGGIALIDLKGLGTDRTAVLVNGRRVPGNPWTGSSAVDINTIPMSAVDRVEILTDSASAVYGADAIGGVVNIIMKQDWEGAEIHVGASRPTRDSANTDSVSFSFGTSYDKGNIMFSGEWYKKLPIFDSDRDYSKVQVNGTTGPTGLPLDGSSDVQGINGGGNSIFAPDFSAALVNVLETGWYRLTIHLVYRV